MVNLFPRDVASLEGRICRIRFSLSLIGMLVASLLLACAPALQAQESRSIQPPPANKRLDTRTKIKLVAAVAALAILGFGLVALTYLGGKWTRRIVNAPPLDRWEDATALVRDDWADKPLTSEERRRLFGPASPR